MSKRDLILLGIFMGILIVCGIIYQHNKPKPVYETYEELSVLMEGTEISALFDDGARLWVGASDGIYWLDNATGELQKKLDAQINMIYAASIVRTSDGTIWAGHDAGISAFDANGNEILRFEAPQIPGGRVNTFHVTGDGLWLGAMEGAAFLSKESGNWEVSRILTKENGLAEDVVEVIESVGDEIWFGSYLATGEGGISILKPDGWDYLSTEDGIQHRYINAILPLSQDEVLIGCGQLSYGGLSRARRTEDGWSIAETWDQEDGIPGMKVRWLFLDTTGRLWITTEADGMLILDNTQSLSAHPLEGLVVKSENGLVDNEVKIIAESETCYWLGGKYGMTRYAK